MSTVTDALTVVATGKGSLVVAPLTMATPPATTDTAQSNNTYTFTGTGGAGSGGTGTTFVTRSYLGLSPTSNPTGNWWCGYNTAVFAGAGSGGTSTTICSAYDQTLRVSHPDGGASTNPEMWGSVIEMKDMTSTKSSEVNNTQSVEIDFVASNVDDAINRQVVNAVIKPWVSGPGFVEVAYGYTGFCDPGGYVDRWASYRGPYVNAALDLREAGGFGRNTSNATAPTLTQAANNTTTIYVSNIVPFLKDRYARDINAGPFTSTVWFADGTSADYNGYVVTGSGAAPAGRLTLLAPVTKASGMAAYNTSHAIWLHDGQTIAFDKAGTTQLWWESATGRLVFSRNGTRLMSIDSSGVMRVAGAVMQNTAP